MSFNFRCVSLCLALCFGLAPAQANPSLECSEAGSQIEIRECVAGFEDAVNVALTAALGFAMDAAKELDDVTGRPVTVPALEASQTAWEQFRDAHCDYVGSTFGGGSGTGIAITSCRIVQGRLRVAALLAQAR